MMLETQFVYKLLESDGRVGDIIELKYASSKHVGVSTIGNPMSSIHQSPRKEIEEVGQLAYLKALGPKPSKELYAMRRENPAL